MPRLFPRPSCRQFQIPAPLLAPCLLLAACGGGGSGTGGTAALAPSQVAAFQASTTGLLAAGCGAAVGNPSASPAEAFTAGSAVQPQLALDPANRLHGAGVWQQDRWNAIGARAIAYAATTDGGATWGAPVVLPFSACGASSGAGAAYDRASDPSIAIGGAAVVYASALAFSAGGYLQSGGTSAVLVARSTDGGSTWQVPTAAIADVNSGAGPYHFNDRDALAAEPAGSHVYLLWDRLSSNPSAESQPTWMLHSADYGAHWDAPRVIYDPGTLTQTFNNQPLVLPDGSVVDIFTQIDGFGASLRAIRSTNHGSTWGSAAMVTASMTPAGTADPVPGGPPVRDSAYMAQTAVDASTGVIAAVWQEGAFSGGARDGIALSLSRDGGATWSAPVQVNAVTAVGAFDPAVHLANGRLAVLYYDFRDYAAGSSTLSTGLWLRESRDLGVTWTETRVAGPFDLLLAAPADQAAGTTGTARFLGDQQGLGWNGAGWMSLFAATGAQGGRVYGAVSP